MEGARDCRVVESDGRDGNGIGARSGGKRNGSWGKVSVEDRTRSDLFPVVIFRVDPENGDGGNLMIARDLVGELERGDGLQQREQRPAEEPRLLAGDDCNRPSRS